MGSKKMKVIMFGATDGEKRLYYEVSKLYEVVAFTDNDMGKWGGDVFGIPIVSPDKAISKLEYDYIVISSAPGLEDIKRQCLEMGVDSDKVITRFVTPELESRRVFLRRLADLYEELNIQGAVAEVGVFAGDFAKYINEYFPDRTCYLFDTFEGFDIRDIEKESDSSSASVGEYNNISVEVVIKKMPYPDKVEIYKGYFPQSAEHVNDKFCFVNLDLDLYELTYQGLKFFSDKMIQNGCILVNDYFAVNFKGPKMAVDQFIKESNNKFRITPIGDGISILINGF